QFLRFELKVGPGTEPIWLELSGPTGTAEFIQRELDLGPSSGDVVECVLCHNSFVYAEDATTLMCAACLECQQGCCGG
ncbi:MAG TPA: hypothetical protein VGO93_28705, partial [Candidatus Xenobia bacterium]